MARGVTQVGAERVRWVPRQHGAWAILAVPLVLGVAAGGARPWHAVLVVAAVSAYLCSVAVLDWARTRRAASLRPAAVFGTVLAGSGIPLLAAHPSLAVIALAAGAAGLGALLVSALGRPKSVVVSLLEVAQALLLVPAAAAISGSLAEPSTGRATLAAGVYLVGSVLHVRALIRERGNRWFLATSLAFHGAAVGVAAVLLPAPYAVLAAAFLARAAILPFAQARAAEGPRRLRPIHIGIGEIAASVALAVLAFVVGF